jgi:putative ABC transport system substrate-binding protein
VDRVDLQAPDDIETAFDLPELGRAQALSTAGSAGFLTPVRARFAELALQHRLPGIALSLYAEVGLLMNYGASPAAASRVAANHVDKILKGARPADLPIELPTVFDFALNVRTAQTLVLAAEFSDHRSAGLRDVDAAR